MLAPATARERISLASARERLRAALAERSRDELLALAASLGIERRSALRALAGRRVNAAAHVALCLALGIDPETGEACAPRTVGPVLWWFVGSALAVVLNVRGLSLRQAALEAGVAPCTLHRVLHGEAVSAENLVAVCAWLRRPPQSFTANTNCNSLKLLEAA